MAFFSDFTKPIMSPRSLISFTSALPTIIPSAPCSASSLTCSGFDTQNPTATGRPNVFLISDIFPFKSTFRASRAPVTPKTDCR
jgi:hypothetical protein